MGCRCSPHFIPRSHSSSFFFHSPSAHGAWNKLSEVGDVVQPTATNRDAFIAECQSGALDGVVAVYRTYTSLSITGRWDAELVKHLPRSLRFVSHVGSGYDQVDAVACAAVGIRVSNVPKAVDDATADTGIFLMLGALRGFWQGMVNLRQGLWRGKPPMPMAHDPQGKVLGFLGMGGIGQNMARKAAVFGVVIRYHKRTRLPEEVERELGAEYVSFDELLATSDVLSLNLPLNVSYFESSVCLFFDCLEVVN
jgi:lactate dehydrogenase-like 2-hydroxyacid dehydrogenase